MKKHGSALCTVVTVRMAVMYLPLVSVGVLVTAVAECKDGAVITVNVKIETVC